MTKCKYCTKELSSRSALSNHQFRCPLNPDRDMSKISRKGQTGRLLTDEQKNHLSSIAKERGLGGYQPNAGRSKKFYVLDSFGKEVCLQSTFELRCSQLLNDLEIQWIRPTALKYDSRNYFADFYLPEHNLYIDPKNSYKAKLDTIKIEKVKEQNNVRVIVLLEHELTHEFIKSLCS